MSFPIYYYKHRVDSSTPYQYVETTLTVMAEKDQISFKKKMAYSLLESTGESVFKEKMPITAKEGFDECQSVPKCREFVESFLKKGYQIN